MFCASWSTSHGDIKFLAKRRLSHLETRVIWKTKHWIWFLTDLPDARDNFCTAVTDHFHIGPRHYHLPPVLLMMPALLQPALNRCLPSYSKAELIWTVFVFVFAFVFVWCQPCCNQHQICASPTTLEHTLAAPCMLMMLMVLLIHHPISNNIWKLV